VSNEITKYDVNMDDLQRMAKMLAMSGYFEASGDASTQIAQMATKILAGRELGYGPFASVQGIHVIKGKPTLSANLMAAAVKAHPRYDYRVRKMDNDEVSIEFFEDKQSLGVSTFNKADANAAGTQNLGKFPRNMLFARAMSNGVRWYCPDVFYGNTVYAPEELGATVDDDGNVEARFTVVDDKKVDTATGEILPNAVAVWLAAEKPTEAAYTWAVGSRIYEDANRAKEALRTLVNAEFGGKFSTANQKDVLIRFYDVMMAPKEAPTAK
jgi:hypothetical protein